MSKLMARELRKRNRLSLAEGIFFFFSVLSFVLLPYSLYKKYEENDYDLDPLISFGSLC